MLLLKTAKGYLSSDRIVLIWQRAQGDWGVMFDNGAGPLDTTCDGAEGAKFVAYFSTPSSG